MATTPLPASPPEPLTLDEVKANLRVDDTDSDALIAALIVTAREYVEDVTGLVLTRRTVTETARQLGAWIDLASWPVVTVSAIRHPVGGAMMALASGSWVYSTARRPVRLLPSQPGWGVAPVFGASSLPVEIDVLAGYATPDDVPMRVKQAMQLLVASWYSNRSAVESGARAAAVEVPLGVADLLRGLRLVRV
jgi:uncharacterized phiE125 gp8 family phage protein